MHVGVPAEVKNNEFRVAMTPAGVHALVGRGHRVDIQAGAGLGAGYTDEEYREAGATIVGAAAEAWSAELVLKVKEPIEQEYGFLREDLTLFTYLHLAADLPLTRQAVVKHLQALVDAGLATATRDGREVRYAATTERLLTAVTWLLESSPQWDKRLERLKRRAQLG